MGVQNLETYGLQLNALVVTVQDRLKAMNVIPVMGQDILKNQNPKDQRWILRNSMNSIRKDIATVAKSRREYGN